MINNLKSSEGKPQHCYLLKRIKIILICFNSFLFSVFAVVVNPLLNIIKTLPYVHVVHFVCCKTYLLTYIVETFFCENFITSADFIYFFLVEMLDSKRSIISGKISASGILSNSSNQSIGSPISLFAVLANTQIKL